MGLRHIGYGEHMRSIDYYEGMIQWQGEQGQSDILHALAQLVEVYYRAWSEGCTGVTI